MASVTRLVLLAVGMSTLITANGCAFGTRHVNLTYGAGVAGSSDAPGTLGQIAVARLQDRRTPDQGTGMLLAKVRNLYGMPTASVEANQDPVIWVSEGLVRGLQQRGFTVEKVDAAATAGNLTTVTGSVTRVHGGMYMNMDAYVEADLAIVQNGTTLYTTPCQGDVKQGAGSASASDWDNVFRAAMDSFIQRCIPLLAPTLQQYPSP